MWVSTNLDGSLAHYTVPRNRSIACSQLRGWDNSRILAFKRNELWGDKISTRCKVLGSKTLGQPKNLQGAWVARHYAKPSDCLYKGTSLSRKEDTHKQPTRLKAALQVPQPNLDSISILKHHTTIATSIHPCRSIMVRMHAHCSHLFIPSHSYFLWSRKIDWFRLI